MELAKALEHFSQLSHIAINPATDHFNEHVLLITALSPLSQKTNLIILRVLGKQKGLDGIIEERVEEKLERDL